MAVRAGLAARNERSTTIRTGAVKALTRLITRLGSDRGGNAILAVLAALIVSANAHAAGPVSVDLSAFVTNDLTNYTGGGNYPQNGGPLSVAGIPFNLATIGPSSHTAIIQNAGVPETFSIPVGVSGVTTVYSLANSANGSCGTTVGELDFVSASSGTFVYLLTEGDNIRDHFEDGFCNTAPNVAGTALFNAVDRLDMQRINLPANFASDTLVRIDFKGYGLSASGRPFLAALTLTSIGAATIPTLSMSAILIAAMLLAALGLWTLRQRSS